VALPAVKVWPAGQVKAQGVHDVAVPALAIKPDVHHVQVRSAVALPAAKASPAGQVAVQGVHSTALVVLL
jgi:hypothetical protein